MITLDRDPNYVRCAEILKAELVPALGCTEPIAIALATAKARELLGREPEKAAICCSGNIIKNVKGVIVPNSGGKKGALIAAALGITGGRSDLGLEVLSAVDDAARASAQAMVDAGSVKCTLYDGEENLYIAATVTAGSDSAEAVIARQHTEFVRLVKNGSVLLEKAEEKQDDAPADDPRDHLTVAGILDFAAHTDLEAVRPVLDDQIEKNSAIADYGLTHACGVQSGKIIMDHCGGTVAGRARARAAAGADARMAGCTLPVVINSGSGNQGITVSVPVIEYARSMHASKEQLYRALIVSNLVSVHQKRFIGNLSAFCGAVSASAGAGAGITFLCGGDEAAVSRTIVNTLGTASGMFCDGAKASCAAKVAAALEAALVGHTMSMAGISFEAGDGVVLDSIEQTMQGVGYVAREGMQSTDKELLRVMTGTAPL